jgi:UDP-N-acetylglucosamine 2-epimerase (non-hydrolysing)
MKNGKKQIDLILGIRPDIIRASSMINKLRENLDIDFRFIWSGQHYSNNLKDVFFQELEVGLPNVELNIEGKNDSELVSDLILKLGKFYEINKSDLSVYLGDTNTVMGAICSAQHQIPIFHIEGCMRSYDWSMPEEKYRTTIDHLSDRIYAYFEEYKQQGISEGINPSSILVTGNIIVDVLNKHYFNKFEKFQFGNNIKLFKKYDLKQKNFVFATAHRRENILDISGLQNIQKLFAHSRHPVLFAAGYRTQAMIKKFGLEFENTQIIDPIGYEELLKLVTNSYGVFTDSGTLVEEACVLGVPCIQMRRSTERPQVYDAGGTIKFNPLNQHSVETIKETLSKLDFISSKIWKHNLGDGTASEKIVDDIIKLALTKDSFSNHSREALHFDTNRAYGKEIY